MIDKIVSNSKYEWRKLMGILDRFMKKQTAAQAEESDFENITFEEKLLINIAASISYNDSTVISEMEECIADTKKYFKNHCEHYEARGIKNADDIGMVRWFTLVDILIHQGYVCELNWKCGREGFLYFIKKNLLVQSEGLLVNEEWLNEDGNITEWCHILDEQWKTLEICIAAIEIEGWNYVIFPFRIKALGVLEDFAERIGHRVYKC